MVEKVWMQYWKILRHFSKKNGLRGNMLRKMEEENVTVMTSSVKNPFFFLKSLGGKQQISKSSK